jgi:hypothetical protein
VLYRSNGRPWLAIVELEDLPDLARTLAPLAGEVDHAEPAGGWVF